MPGYKGHAAHLYGRPDVTSSVSADQSTQLLSVQRAYQFFNGKTLEMPTHRRGSKTSPPPKIAEKKVNVTKFM